MGTSPSKDNSGEEAAESRRVIMESSPLFVVPSGIIIADGSLVAPSSPTGSGVHIPNRSPEEITSTQPTIDLNNSKLYFVNNSK